MLTCTSAMTALYQNRLEFGARKTIQQTPADMAAFFALESVLSMIQDIIQTNDRREGPVSLPVVILYYLVGGAIMTLSKVYPSYLGAMENITDLLTSHSQRSQLASRWRPPPYNKECLLCFYLTISIEIYAERLSQLSP